MEFIYDIISIMSTTVVWIGTVFLLLISCFARMVMFVKAGEAGYKAWIPFYRDYTLCKISMGSGWYFLLGFFPLTYPILRVLYAIEVSLSFGRGLGSSILYFFFPTLMTLVYGFGSAYYVGSRNLVEQIKGMFHGFFG